MTPVEQPVRCGFALAPEFGILILEECMRAASIIGIVLIVAGALGFVYEGITYTRHKEVVSVGPISATAEEKETIPISPVLSGVAILVGIGLLVVGQRRAG
jgi:hypothetical protein